MIKEVLLFAIFFVFIILSFLPNLVSAQCPTEGLVPCGTEGCPCTLCHLFLMFQGIVNFFLFNIVPIVAVLMLVIGGFLFFFASGSPAALSRAKSTITSAVIGLIIIYTAWLIINTFFVIIGVESWTNLAGGWFTITCSITP